MGHGNVVKSWDMGMKKNHGTWKCSEIIGLENVVKSWDMGM
jgi:hypothetical protein